MSSGFMQPIYFNYTQFDPLCVPNAFWHAMPIFANVPCAPLTSRPAVLTLQLLVFGCVYWELIFGVVPILVVNWRKAKSELWICIALATVTLICGTAMCISLTDLVYPREPTAPIPVGNMVAISIFLSFWIVFYMIAVTLRTVTLTKATNPKLTYCLGALAISTALFALIVICTMIYFASKKMDVMGTVDFMNTVTVPVLHTNIWWTVIADFIISATFIWKLCMGLSVKKDGVFAILTNPTLLRSPVGWGLGLWYAAVGNDVLNCIQTMWMAWQLHTFATFSLQEVKTIVQLHSMSARGTQNRTSGIKSATEKEQKDSATRKASIIESSPMEA